MSINSREKGCRGERELAAYLRDRGFEAIRGQQHAGGADSQDVKHNVPGVHIECKRVERGNLYDWLHQAQRDAGPGNTPVVMHRRNKKEWVAILPLDDYLTLIRAANTSL